MDEAIDDIKLSFWRVISVSDVICFYNETHALTLILDSMKAKPTNEKSPGADFKSYENNTQTLFFANLTLLFCRLCLP